LNERVNFFTLYLRRKEFYHFSLRVDEKFSEVPGNHFCSICFGVKKLTIVSQINEKRMSIFTIYFNLFHNWELYIEIFFDKFVDFFRWSTFLSKELVARESQNLKSDLSPSCMSFNHFFVIIWSKSSLASNISHHDKSPISESFEIKEVSFDILDLEIEESLDKRSLELFLPWLENKFGK